MNPLIRTLKRDFKGISRERSKEIMRRYHEYKASGILSEEIIWEAIREFVRGFAQERDRDQKNVFDHTSLDNALQRRATIAQRRAKMKARRKK